MVQRNDIIQFINTLLTPENFDDYCINGLQVEGKTEIRKIILGVSVSERFFREAVSADGDMIITHHGLFWKSDPHPFHLTGIAYRRAKILIQHEINLLGYHLPLDAHPEIGNNAQILKHLELTPLEPVDVGFLGELSTPMSFEAFRERVDRRLNTKSYVLPYGSDTVRKVLVISGGSSPAFETAKLLGADVFIAGDIRENLVRSIEETGINFINAGHYNTEKPGIQALGERLEANFSIPCTFIDIPNPV